MEATIRFVTASEMSQLNNRFKGGQGPTNVLTFVEGSCADIAICPQIAKADAISRGWDVASELNYLSVHGCLHALGFDHVDRDGRTEMENLERRILAEIGIDAQPLGAQQD